MRRLSRNRAIDPFIRTVVGAAGFTMVEVLIAIVFLSVGIVAVLTAVGAGVHGIDGGRRSTIAVFLSEQRMEQVKAFALSQDPTQGWVNIVAASFPAEGYGTIAGYPDYRRTVTITNTPGGAANTKQIEVWVFYRPTGTGVTGAENSMTTATLLVAR
jgi:Tfp pilus assembly protein PilV